MSQPKAQILSSASISQREFDILIKIWSNLDIYVSQYRFQVCQCIDEILNGLTLLFDNKKHSLETGSQIAMYLIKNESSNSEGLRNLKHAIPNFLS